MNPPAVRDLGSAAAQGDLTTLERLIQTGADVNKRSSDGMTPLSIAAFWGYADIVRSLLNHRETDINAQNKGTDWTPLHCAAFQGHGPVILRLLEHKPDLRIKDNRGRTAADFASALDSVWPLFAASKCRRTPKADLIRMDIVHKVSSSMSSHDPTGRVPDSRPDLAHFSRPGSAYAMRSQMPMAEYSDPSMAAAAVTGDVLASLHEEPSYQCSVNTTQSSPESLGQLNFISLSSYGLNYI